MLLRLGSTDFHLQPSFTSTSRGPRSEDPVLDVNCRWPNDVTFREFRAGEHSFLRYVGDMAEPDAQVQPAFRLEG